ncbi:MAG: hypothetical protein WB987_14115 [Candidatus Acidiferrales bacterium]
MQASDRRFRQRLVLQVPLKIRNIDMPGTPEQLVESTDISARGLYFSTDAPLEVGAKVELFLTMPAAIVGADSRMWRCMGRVVRRHACGPVEGKSGNGIEILYYEVLDREQQTAANAPRLNGFPVR